MSDDIDIEEEFKKFLAKEKKKAAKEGRVLIDAQAEESDIKAAVRLVGNLRALHASGKLNSRVLKDVMYWVGRTKREVKK